MASSRFFHSTHEASSRLVALIAILIIFVIDLQFPLGVAAAIPYLLVIFLLRHTDRLQDFFLFAAISSLLTVLGFFFSPPGGEFPKVIANRVLAIVIIWTVAYAFWSARNAEMSRQGLLARFQNALESSPIANVMIDEEGNIILVNKETEQLFGYDRSEMLDQPVEILLPERFRSQHPELRLAFLRSPTPRRMGEGRDLFALRKDGSEFPVEIGINPVPTTDETLVLSAIIDLTERKKQTKALEQLNARLESLVDERTQELEKSNIDLANRNEEVQTFVYGVSHDIRSPLVNIDGFTKELELLMNDLTGLLQVSPISERNQQKALKIVETDLSESVHYIHEGVVRLSSITDALLRLSRAGQVEYRNETVRMSAIIQRIVNGLRARMRDKNVSIEVSDLPDVQGDPFAIEQVFTNLMENAVKYLDPSRPGQIQVDCDTPEEDKMVIFRVKDNGLGIPDKDKSKVFQPLKRFHTDAAPGDGVGLSIVLRIIKRHQGEVTLESEEGVGTTFFVKLPIVASVS